MEIFRQTETWVFLAIWNGILGVYWHYRYNSLANAMLSPYFLALVAKELESMNEDDQTY